MRCFSSWHESTNSLKAKSSKNLLLPRSVCLFIDFISYLRSVLKYLRGISNALFQLLA